MTELFQNHSQADLLLSAAQNAFLTYRKTTGRQRAAFLRTIADEIEALGDHLIETASRESRLPSYRITGERGRTIAQLRMFAGLLEEGSWVDAHIDTAIPDRAPIPKPDIRKILIPLGPVIVFGASNFPLAFSTAGGDTASALAAGCPVIVKAHPAHPDTSTLVALAIARAVGTHSLPEATFQHAVGDIPLGQALVAHPLSRVVAFTGSLHAGKSLFDIASRRKEPIPVFAEMGSVNPTVILPSALRENARSIAATLAASITLGVGQFCTNPGLVFVVDSPLLDGFIETLSKSISEVAPAPMLTESIAGHYNRSLSKHLDAQGVEVIATASTVKQANLGTATVARVSAAHFIANPTLADEVFGPFSMLVTCHDKDELLMAVNSLAGQLTASIWASETELPEQSDLFDALVSRVGRLIVNGAPTGVEVCPSMHHGGPFPASTDSRSTSVGTDAIKRFVRPLAYQNIPQSMLPTELHDDNPLGILRLVNGTYTRDSINK